MRIVAIVLVTVALAISTCAAVFGSSFVFDILENLSPALARKILIQKIKWVQPSRIAIEAAFKNQIGKCTTSWPGFFNDICAIEVSMLGKASGFMQYDCDRNLVFQVINIEPVHRNIDELNINDLRDYKQSLVLTAEETNCTRDKIKATVRCSNPVKLETCEVIQGESLVLSIKYVEALEKRKKEIEEAAEAELNRKAEQEKRDLEAMKKAQEEKKQAQLRELKLQEYIRNLPRLEKKINPEEAWFMIAERIYKNADDKKPVGINFFSQNTLITNRFVRHCSSKKPIWYITNDPNDFKPDTCERAPNIKKFAGTKTEAALYVGHKPAFGLWRLRKPTTQELSFARKKVPGTKTEDIRVLQIASTKIPSMMILTHYIEDSADSDFESETYVYYKNRWQRIKLPAADLTWDYDNDGLPEVITNNKGDYCIYKFYDQNLGLVSKALYCSIVY